MDFNVSRLRQGEKIAGACAVLLFLDMFLHWYKVSVSSSGALGSFINTSGLSASASAWNAYSLIDLVLLLTIIVTLAMVLLTGTQRTVALPVTASVIAGVLGALSTLLVLYRDLISKPGKTVSQTTAAGSINVHVTTQIFGWLGLLLCAGLTYGCYLAMREEGVSLGDARTQAAGAFQGSTRPAPPARGTSAPGATTAPGAPGTAGTPPPATTPPPGDPGGGVPPRPEDPGGGGGGGGGGGVPPPPGSPPSGA